MSARWPVVLSVPHAGHQVPERLSGRVRLTPDEILHDSDVQAPELYLPWRLHAAHFVTTPIARAFVDMNRAEDDIRRDGVVKTHTCWNVPIYSEPLLEEDVEALLVDYHRPYHDALRLQSRLRIGLDLHTMAEFGPPVGPDPGAPRPWVCVGDADGEACDPEWSEALVHELGLLLGAGNVSHNVPFRGGYITRSRPGERSWIQIEVSRGSWASVGDKRQLLFSAIDSWLTTLWRQLRFEDGAMAPGSR